MTQHLVREDEVAPLLCDEVTVQSDQRRATQLLELLHEVSRERQVVVFTHDERALAWAETALDGEGDRLIRLDEAA
jgi:ABC-type lipoprotein export system ATPase subunit